MRLSDEKARRLTALVWRERARRWLLAVIVVLAVAGALTYMLSSQVQRADRTVDERTRIGFGNVDVHTEQRQRAVRREHLAADRRGARRTIVEATVAGEVAARGATREEKGTNEEGSSQSHDGAHHNIDSEHESRGICTTLQIASGPGSICERQ